MPVVFHSDPESFAAAARGVASRSPCSEAFVAIWCAGLKHHPPAPDVPWLLLTAESGDSRALAMQHGRNPLLLEHSDPEAAKAIAQVLADAGHPVPGVDGSQAACDAFASAWRERTGRSTAERVRLRHHVLSRVLDVPVPEGGARMAEGRDAAWLVAAFDAFLVEARVPRAPQGTERLVQERLDDRRFRLWERGDNVSFLGANLVDGIYARIGPVYTPPEQRGRGYATALVAAASRELIGRGARQVFLTTDLANPVSNAIYARVGFRPVDDTVALDFVDP
jgi:GNAT superfamily N-acetyltransferase